MGAKALRQSGGGGGAPGRAVGKPVIPIAPDAGPRRNAVTQADPVFTDQGFAVPALALIARPPEIAVVGPKRLGFMFGGPGDAVGQARRIERDVCLIACTKSRAVTSVQKTPGIAVYIGAIDILTFDFVTPRPRRNVPVTANCRPANPG